MECLLLVCLSNLYFNIGIGYADTPSSHIQAWKYQPEHAPAVIGFTGVRPYDLNLAANPMARVSFGHEWEPSVKVRISLEVSHESWLGTGKDKGLNSAWVSLKTFPWRE